jgi:dethiobiotin synthetase
MLTVLALPMRNVLQQHADFTLVEGAGGWRVPLSGRRTCRTWRLP